MKLIVAGSREFTNYEFLKKTLDKLLINQKDIEIVCGMARGADLLGKRYAEERGYKVVEFPADWDQYKKAAGYIRNKDMAQYGTHLVAFWNGSKGTGHMIDLAKEFGLPTRVIKV